VIFSLLWLTGTALWLEFSSLSCRHLVAFSKHSYAEPKFFRITLRRTTIQYLVEILGVLSTKFQGSEPYRTASSFPTTRARDGHRAL
jgi:hypothetical protein